MNETDFVLRDIVGLVRRQFRLIVATLAAVLTIATGLSFLLQQSYTAQTLVMVDTSHKDLLDPNAQLTSSQDSPRIDSEVELVKSETTMQRVVQDAQLFNNADFKNASTLFDNFLYLARLKERAEPTQEDRFRTAFEKLVDSVTVARKGTTYLISISARSPNPETAAMIANAVAKAYIEEQLSSKINSVLAANNAILGRIGESNKSVVKSEQAFDRFIDENVERIAASTGRTDLVALRAQIEQSTRSGTSLAAQVEAGNESATKRDWEGVANTLRDEAIAKLAAERKRVEESLASAGAGDNASFREQLKQIEAQLAARTSTVLGTLKSDLASSQASISQLRQELRSSVLGAELPADMLASIYEVQQTAEIARGQYQALLARAKDLEAQAFLQVADSRIVSNALVPTAPSFPNKRLIFGLAAVLGVVGGVAVGLAYETLIGGFTSADQLRNQTRLTVPTSIPREIELKSLDPLAPSLTLADYLTAFPLSPYSESVRRLRVGLDQAARRARTAHGDDSKSAVIMVTSSLPGEGKTTTALALARAYAMSGNTTILVDCDLRRPSLHKQLGLEPSPGLLEYLTGTGEHSLRSIATTDRASGVHVVLGARQSEVATDQFVAGPSFTRLIDAARSSFDVVILDTPPVGPVVDGLYIASAVDVIAMLVRHASTSQREVRSALIALDDSKRPSTEILAVLNQDNERSRSYRGRHEAYYTRA